MKRKRVRESAPVQVYLTAEEEARLTRLVAQLGISKSEVIRRGLLSLEREVRPVEEHPLLAMIGVFDGPVDDADGLDPAVDHDLVIGNAKLERSGLLHTSPTPRRPRRAR